MELEQTYDAKSYTIRTIDGKTHRQWRIAATILGQNMGDFAVEAIKEKLVRMADIIKPAVQDVFKGREETSDALR